jgi:hypothetical protein
MKARNGPKQPPSWAVGVTATDQDILLVITFREALVLAVVLTAIPQRHCALRHFKGNHDIARAASTSWSHRTGTSLTPGRCVGRAFVSAGWPPFSLPSPAPQERPRAGDVSHIRPGAAYTPGDRGEGSPLRGIARSTLSSRSTWSSGDIASLRDFAPLTARTSW